MGLGSEIGSIQRDTHRDQIRSSFKSGTCVDETRTDNETETETETETENKERERERNANGNEYRSEAEVGDIGARALCFYVPRAEL